MALLTDKAAFQFSTQGRSGTPDGNIYLDTVDPANPKIQLFSSSEVPTMAGSVTNTLDPNDGATMQAIYGAIGIERRDNETIRQFLKPSVGVFALAGSYDILNNWQFATATDLGLVRSSGIRYLAVNGSVNRIYFGPKSLSNIESASQPYYQTAALGASTDFSFAGDVDELVQVFGTTANGDSGAGNFDTRAYFAVSVREWGRIHDRKDLTDSGLSSAAQYSGGFGLGESPHPTTGNYTEANVLGGSAIAPWSTMSYLTEAAPVTRTGFNEADGDFSESIKNPNGGTLDEVIAFMDALARSAADIDDGTPTQIGKDVDVLYSFVNVGGVQKVKLKQGLIIEGLPGADLPRILATADNGDDKTYPSLITVNVSLSNAAKGESTSWYHGFIEDDTDGDDYNTATAITAQDKDGVEIKGTVGVSTQISFDINFSAIPGGTNIPANTAYVIRFIVGDDPDNAGGPVENFALIPIDGSVSTINIDLSNETENNV